MRKVFFILIIIFLFINCGYKKSLTRIEFEDIMKDYDYEISKIIDDKFIPPAEKTVALKDGCKVEYLEGYSEGFYYFYYSYIHNLEDSKKKKDKSKNITHDLFHGGSKYILETDDNIKIVRLKDEMLIYADCPLERKKNILKIMKDFD
ncbi:hypothetical protein [Sebaldella sp. S0638]|uniref:hypothetical protein n=1 Tax=Sebaldella sp. S0638 TaxID=2957809 RepID=UPI00209FD2F8|nr:hypothetical protein [Sebaldella sp. S0638]MCP1225105.1 hypothetical protein [Sebaldella sp. S0638]